MKPPLALWSHPGLKHECAGSLTVARSMACGVNMAWLILRSENTLAIQIGLFLPN
jgi:hypothetical protein